MKVNVYVEEISRGWVTIDVDNEDEIRQRAEDAYYDGRVLWDGGEFQVQSYERIRQNQIHINANVRNTRLAVRNEM